MILFALFFATGISLLQLQAVLPDLYGAVLLLPLIIATLWLKQHSKFATMQKMPLAVLALACGFFHAAWMAQLRLSDELPAAWQGRDIVVTGHIAEMPRLHERGVSFTFDVEQILTAEAHVPRHIQLSVFQTGSMPALPVHAGEFWQLTVRLKQPHGSSNPHTGDFEVWALERNLRAFGYVHPKGQNLKLGEAEFNPAYSIERMREHIREHFRQALGDAPYSGILSALAIGDQASIPAGQWQIFTRTGVNHLMSISGLHITMLAGLMFWLVNMLWRQSAALTLHLPARKAAALAALFTACIYALVAGYGVPAQRTVYMLAAMTATLWLAHRMQAAQMLAVALMVVLLLDPWAVSAPGFWLSFGAVALIFYTTQNRLQSGNWLVEYGRIQWAMSIGLIPPLLAMFQQLSIVSPVANAFAIPVISFIVTPLTLLGALPHFEWGLHLAILILNWLMRALEWLSSLPLAVWNQHAPPLWCIIIGMLGVNWILLPRGFPARWLGAMLLLPMFLIEPAAPKPETLRLIIFDVGQGLAVAAQTRHHALLYDTGPAYNSETNSGNRILVPSLRGMGINQLDTLILTHDDMDHTGGAISVLQAMPVKQLVSSLPDDSPILAQAKLTTHCHDQQQWQWDGVQFTMLHPALADYRSDKIKNNDMGCVLRISAGDHSILLAADIEKKSELRLLEQHAAQLKAQLLVVPHHGSKTSSTENFVRAVHPDVAVFTAGYRNSFGHPKDEVVARYQSIKSEVLRSDVDGAIIVELNNTGMHIDRYRKTNARYWQHANSSASTDIE